MVVNDTLQIDDVDLNTSDKNNSVNENLLNQNLFGSQIDKNNCNSNDSNDLKLLENIEEFEAGQGDINPTKHEDDDIIEMPCNSMFAKEDFDFNSPVNNAIC